MEHCCDSDRTAETYMGERRDWRRAGTILVTAALSAIEARLSSLPLLIEVAATILGCTLIIKGKRAYFKEKLGGSLQSPIEFTLEKLDKVKRLCTGKTDLQIHASREYYGR